MRSKHTEQMCTVQMCWGLFVPFFLATNPKSWWIAKINHLCLCYWELPPVPPKWKADYNIRDISALKAKEINACTEKSWLRKGKCWMKEMWLFAKRKIFKWNSEELEADINHGGTEFYWQFFFKFFCHTKSVNPNQKTDFHMLSIHSN